MSNCWGLIFEEGIELEDRGSFQPPREIDVLLVKTEVNCPSLHQDVESGKDFCNHVPFPTKLIKVLKKVIIFNRSFLRLEILLGVVLFISFSPSEKAEVRLIGREVLTIFFESVRLLKDKILRVKVWDLVHLTDDLINVDLILILVFL